MLVCANMYTKAGASAPVQLWTLCVWLIATVPELTLAGETSEIDCGGDSVSVLFNHNGDRRCVCASNAVCSGPKCIHGRRHQDNASLHGFPATCTDCKCVVDTGLGVPSTVKFNPEVLDSTQESSSSWRGPEPSLVPAPDSVFKRRQCVQKALRGALGFDYNEKYFVMGCNSPAMFDFDNWAKKVGCGMEPITGTLLFHTAWTGPIDKYRTEFEALLDSWLMTQDTSRSEFHFWYMDRDPDPSDSFIKHYTTIGRGKIIFHRVNLHKLAEGTCLEGKHEYLNATVPPDWHEKRVMGPKEKADMTRILLLHNYGGIWLDTDDVLLRDLRPVIEFAGEFATQLTMSFYFNNNVLGVRKGSALSKGLVDIVCMLPYNRDYTNYCKVVKEYCYPKWYWNHGVFQIAERNHLGAITFPMSFTDPAYGCYPPMLLSSSGGTPIRNWELYDVLELIRGAFVLHTRGYNAKKPLHPESNFYKLYKIAKDGAEKQEDTPVPIVKIGARTPAEQSHYDRLYGRLKPTHVEPPFIPKAQWVLIQLEPLLARSYCMYAERSPGSYGPLSKLEVRPKCADEKILEEQEQGLPKWLERHTWMWHVSTGHIRPAIREPGRVYCLDSEQFPRPVVTDPPIVGVCNPVRLGQIWQLRNIGNSTSVQIYNPHIDRCLVVRPEESKDAKFKWRVAMSECDTNDDIGEAQKWQMHEFKQVTHGVKL